MVSMGGMPGQDMRPSAGRYLRDVEQHPTVDVTGATEALVVGPDDVLIVSFGDHVTVEEMEHIRDRMKDSGLRPGQILLIAGADRMVKMVGALNTTERREPDARIVHRQTIQHDTVNVGKEGLF